MELPNDVTMLTKLRYPIIDVGGFESSASSKLCRLEHLQTLKSIEANSCVVRNLGCLTRMRTLGIMKVLESYNTDL
jgi:disease resistance protein RPM1